AHDFYLHAAVESGEDRPLKGVASLKRALKHVFIDNAPLQMRDLEAIDREFRPDLVLCDPVFIGASWYHQKTGRPLAVLNVHPVGMTSRDTAPNGLGMAPDA